MVQITLYKIDGFGGVEHIEDPNSYLAYVDVVNENTQEPKKQSVQIGSTMTINYLPHGWVIIEGDYVTIQHHDGKGNHIPSEDLHIKMGGPEWSKEIEQHHNEIAEEADV